MAVKFHEMLINMEPRYVLDDFESIVSVQRMDLLRQKILEMPNNDTNAWKMHKPVAYSATEYCGLQDDIFETEENCIVEGPHSKDYSNAATMRDDDFKSDFFRGGQCQQGQGYGTSMQYSQVPLEAMNNYTRPNPVPRHFYSDMSLSYGANTYIGSSNGQSCGQNYTTAMFAPPRANSSMAVTNSGLAQSYLPLSEVSSWNTNSSIGSDRTSSSLGYASYSPVISSPNQQLLGIENLNIHNDGLQTGSMNWPEDFGNLNQDLYTAIYDSGGLSKSQALYQSPHDAIPSNSGSVNTVHWPTEFMTEDTISPTALRINMSNTPLSSSESSQEPPSGWSEYQNDETVESRTAKPHVIKDILRGEKQRHRRLLPDSTISSQRIAPMPVNRDVVDRSIRQMPRRSKNHERRKASPALTRMVMTKETPHQPETASCSPSASENTECEYPSENLPETTTQSWATIDNSPGKATHKRNPQDDFLVRSKLAGMSYKDIKKHGQFKEAESTLRGRFRTLTKDKSARVRKPEWNENDDRILRKAVRKLTPNGDKRKTPWKQVATYIADNGGSYHFGNATCRKRWDDLQANS